MIFQNNTNVKTMKKIKSIIIITIALCTISCASCSKDSKKTSSAGKNFLSFKIDGVLWESKADKVFGSYHFNESLGNKLLQISGSKGDAPNDQPFNINIYNTLAEDTYTFNQDNPDNSVAQIAQLSETKILCGGAGYDYDFTVVVTKVSKTPQIVEATFNGTMVCSDGSTISITDGKFSYHE